MSIIKVSEAPCVTPFCSENTEVHRSQEEEELDLSLGCAGVGRHPAQAMGGGLYLGEGGGWRLERTLLFLRVPLPPPPETVLSTSPQLLGSDVAPPREVSPLLSK